MMQNVEIIMIDPTFLATTIKRPRFNMGCGFGWEGDEALWQLMKASGAARGGI